MIIPGDTDFDIESMPEWEYFLKSHLARITKINIIKIMLPVMRRKLNVYIFFGNMTKKSQLQKVINLVDGFMGVGRFCWQKEGF